MLEKHLSKEVNKESQKLREAAESDTDQGLKEELWKDYKNSSI